MSELGPKPSAEPKEIRLCCHSRDEAHCPHCYQDRLAFEIQELIAENERLRKRLEVAEEALTKIGNEAGSPTMSYAPNVERKELLLCRERIAVLVKDALAKIKEMRQ